MSFQILNCRFHAFIDLDLLDAGIALDVQNAIGNEQIVVEFLCAADVQDRVRFAIKLPNSVLIAGQQWDCPASNAHKRPSDSGIRILAPTPPGGGLRNQIQ